MPVGPLIVTALRLVVPLSIFRWPLAGGIVSMLLDAIDVVLIGVLNLGDFSSYPQVDKFLDTYYLSFEVYMSLKWQNKLAKGTSIALFAYRVAGVVLFEFTGIRYLLLIFPNLFENFFLFFLIYKKVRKSEELSLKGLILWLIILLIPKLAQEYILHFLEFGPWNWVRINILKGAISDSLKIFKL